MTRGYLLDTCIVSIWFDPSHPRFEAVEGHIRSLPSDAPLRISVVTLGEVEYGHLADSPQGPTPVQQQFLSFLRMKFIDGAPEILDVRRSTTSCYGQLRAALFEKFAPAGRRRKAKRVEELVNPVTSRELGIQENDVWLAAQAIEYRLVLVTEDKMTHIRKVARGFKLDIEDWTR